MSYVPSLKKLYLEHVVPELTKSRGYKNKHQVPQISKIKLNTGIDSEADKNQIADIARDMGSIAGQKPILTKSRKAIASFKLREGQVVGCTVTLRGASMWEFLQRLLAVARKLKVTRDDLADANYLPVTARLTAGDTLIVPREPELLPRPSTLLAFASPPGYEPEFAFSIP